MWRGWLGLMLGAALAWVVVACGANSVIILLAGDRSAYTLFGAGMMSAYVLGPIAAVFGAFFGYQRIRRAEPPRLPAWAKDPEESTPRDGARGRAR